LTTYVERAGWGVWRQRAALLPANYVELVADAGGVPVLLPPIVPGELEAAAAAAMAGVQGLVLTGGSDVDPGAYGATPHPATDAPRAERDGWELALLRAALAADRPVLAVCRGAQLLNVARGGTLHQHLPDVVGADTHRLVPGVFASVPVRVDAGSRLASIVGEAPEVHCHHHQAIDRLGDDVIVCARAADGTIEGVELAGPAFVVGVQWHPEQDGDGRLFAALVEAASSVRRS
jgi:gamma-glutamyl-gamma-aminobutyrate hydrolase PuuD